MARLRRRPLAAAVLVAVVLGAGLQHLTGRAGLPQGDAARGPVGLGGHSGVAGPARPLTYAEDGLLHLGRRSVATGKDVLSLDVVDGGVAFTTLDGGVWFTDGSRPVLVGLTAPGVVRGVSVAWGLAGRPEDWVVSDNSGSHFAWFEYPMGDRPEIVVYDAREQEQVARVPVDLKGSCERCVQIVSVTDLAVYWTDSLWRGLGSAAEGRESPRPFRHEYADSRTSQVALGTLRTDLLGRGRMLVVGDTVETGRLTDGVGQDFVVDGGHLTQASAASRSSGAADAGRQVFDPRTGRRLVFGAPPRYGYGIVERLRLFQWLDDDRFALFDATGWNAGDLTGEDFLVCRISTTRCTVALERPASSGSPVVPELPTPGGARALARAIGR